MEKTKNLLKKEAGDVIPIFKNVKGIHTYNTIKHLEAEQEITDLNCK